MAVGVLMAWDCGSRQNPLSLWALAPGELDGDLNIRKGRRLEGHVSVWIFHDSRGTSTREHEETWTYAGPHSW
jgi:hypothetical protein